MVNKLTLQDELDNLELFVLPEVEGRLADVLAMTQGDPDWEYREQDEEDARTELGDVKRRIAALKERLTPDAADRRVCTCDKPSSYEMVDGWFCGNCGMPARR